MENKLKAYVISDVYCGADGSIIVWAETAGKAKSKALYDDLFDNYEYTELRAERIKDFDKYSETKHIPISELLSYGWWFYCANCCKDMRLSEDDVNNGNAFIVDEDYEREDFVKGNVICKECYKKLKQRVNYGKKTESEKRI